MKDSDDPLELLNDDGDGVVEMSLLEEEEKSKTSGSGNKSGCSVVLLLLDSSLIITEWRLSWLA
jgi:hypothetical protein